MTLDNIQQWIEHPEKLNSETLYELRTMVARYPYFQTLRLLYLKNLYLLHDAAYGAELRKSAPYITDRAMLFYLIEGERYYLKPQAKAAETAVPSNPEEPDADRTLTLIDAFLSDSSGLQLEQNMQMDYNIDYAAFMMKEEEDNKRKEEEKTKQQKTGNSRQPDTGEDELDDSYFTETLAKIYIRQHRYDRALEIFRKLSLNNPKKSTYFADQIKLLEKIINDKTI